MKCQRHRGGKINSGQETKMGKGVEVTRAYSRGGWRIPSLKRRPHLKNSKQGK